MKRFLVGLILTAVLPHTGVNAAETVGQQRTVTRTYVSPGGSASIGESSRQQRSSGFGGEQVPDNRYGESTYQGNSATQIRGNVQQSTQYPGVGEVQRQPGSRSLESNQP